MASSTRSKRHRVDNTQVIDEVMKSLADGDGTLTNIISALKDTIATHEDKIERLKIMKDPKYIVQETIKIHKDCIESIKKMIHKIMGKMLGIHEVIEIDDIDDEPSDCDTEDE